MIKLDRKQPGKATTQNIRGLVYLAKRDLKSARQSFEQAFATDPKDFSAAYNLALIDLQEGKPEDAEMRSAGRIIRVRGDWESVVSEGGRVDRLFATAIHADLRRAALPAKRVAFINFSAALVARMAHVVRVTRLKLQQLQLPVQMGSQVRLRKS